MRFKPLVAAALSSAAAGLLPVLQLPAQQLPEPPVAIPLGLDLHLPVPPSNPLTPEKIALGRQLFFDTRLSVDGSTACATCHDPERAFTDGKPVAEGVYERRGTRNAPTLVNRAYGASHFLDGRAASLEEQVLQPIEGEAELAFEIGQVVDRLRADQEYGSAFYKAFGRPVEAATVAEALASYVRSILSGDSRFDRHVAGDEKALSREELEGMRLFMGKANCTACHIGPTLSDEDFHNTGVAWAQTSRAGAVASMFPSDSGRIVVTGEEPDMGAFKTPTLRDIMLTAPYMHDGSIATLEEVVDFYDRGGNPNPYLDRRIRPLRLSVDEKTDLVAFLRSLTGAALTN